MALSARGFRLTVILVVALLVLAAAGTWQLARLRAWNALIASDEVALAPDDAPAAVRFAKAHTLAARGRVVEALAVYRQLANDEGAAWRAAAAFNAGNLLLREGLALRARGDEFRALPMLEMAKETYRELLRERPDHWDARYNLELALRAAPEPEEEEVVSSPPPVPVRRSAIILRQATPGLP